MKPEEFKKEHVRLIRLLRTGTKTEQLAEAARQEEELKKTIETSKPKPTIRSKLKKA